MNPPADTASSAASSAAGGLPAAPAPEGQRQLLQALLLEARQAREARDAAAEREALERARLLAPADAGVALALAAACLAAGDAPAALAHAGAAARTQPLWQASALQAQACQRLGRADEAAAHLRSLLADAGTPATRRGAALRELADLQLNAFGDARAAALALDEAARGQPALALQAALAALVADLYEGTRRGVDIAAGFAALAGQLGVPREGEGPARAPRAPGARPRIGLVSAQFCASPVGFLTLGALRALAREADLIFFDRGAKADWARTEFLALAHRWVSCRALDAATLRRLLLAADLDALIDLGGWTDPEALAAVASRPARRQLKWVGGQSLSTGLRCFDGFIADARQVPPAAAGLYSEPVLHARHGYVTYTAPPYAPALARAAAQLPAPAARPSAGVYALVSNPAKISTHTARALEKLKPRRLVLVDQRWRHEGTRQAARRRLGALMDVAEFVTPANHPDYLQALAALDASFVDTAPYAMGLTAIELRLLGKALHCVPRSPTALMCERHGVAHLGARRFDHHAELGAQLLAWSLG
ncbi:hypothetical protein [Azohydromonas lata]|uniref:hypothetical protein n=1 Tax=Azohydromonas lata TaxID=45677 RepID=UPI000835757A|nr:hypothetical protein [Azohydromonas lata]